MVIGLVGKAGSGKTTAVNTLKTRGRPVYVNKFAATLYSIQNFIYKAISPVYTPPEDFVKDRVLLQTLGDWGRNTIDINLFVKLWSQKTDKVLSQDENVIVVSDDTRYDAEAEAVRKAKGVVIHIIRDNSAAHAVGGTGIPNHSSEAGVSPALIDYTIHNTGNLKEFQAALNATFDKIKADQGLDNF